jgi:CheY-like chemotaxis protein
MSHIHSGFAVPRHFVFILADGSFVVQWDENRVQDLLTGKVQAFSREKFGHLITDYELNQLKSAGRVEHFTRSYVWIYALPEQNRYSVQLKSLERNRIRSYYVSTGIAEEHYQAVCALLEQLDLAEEFAPEIRSGTVTILGKDGGLFHQLEEAEQAQRLLASRAPDAFGEAVVAFVEKDEDSLNQEVSADGDPVDLATIIASQTDTELTDGKSVVLLIIDPEEQNAVYSLCAELRMNVQVASSGSEAIRMLEDGHSDLLIMDLHLPDMHGWELLAKLKELDLLDRLPLIVISEPSDAANQQSFALTVAKVNVYLVKPVSRARLRQNIWMSLKTRYTP